MFNQFRKEREKQGLSKREVSRRADTNPQKIKEFEDGKLNPTVNFLKKMAKALGKKLKITLE